MGNNYIAKSQHYPRLSLSCLLTAEPKMYKIRICNTKGTINTQYDQAHKMYINLDLTSPHIKSM